MNYRAMNYIGQWTRAMNYIVYRAMGYELITKEGKFYFTIQKSKL